MIGTTLSDIRRHIETLASPTGSYYLVCTRTGDRPVPADGLYFDCRPTAQAAATATEQYRIALGRYDPQLPRCDVIVCERADVVRSPDDPRHPVFAGPTDHHTSGEPTDHPVSSEPVGRPDAGGSTVDFCHTVAGVVFETIAESPHTGVQTAIMDRYLDLAETVAHPDELCLRLIESIAAELDERLTPGDQAAILRTAAARLPAPATTAPTVDPLEAPVDPLEATLDALRSVSILGTYVVDRRSVGRSGTRWEVSLDGYQFGTAGRVVTLPLVVELFRRLSTVALRLTGVERTAGSPPSWHLTLTASPTRTDGPLSVVGAGRS